MQDSLSAQVAGSSSIFPRGYLWLAPVWYAIVAAWLAWAQWPPVWFRLSAMIGLLGALITFLVALSTLSVTAFTADETGVWLGLPPFTKRHGLRRKRTTYLPWQYVERVRMRARPTGVRLEIILNPNAHLTMLAYQTSRVQQAWRWMTLFIPFLYLHRPTALTTPLDRPLRYEVTLRGTTVEELRMVLRALAPREVAVAVLVRKRPPAAPAAVGPTAAAPAAGARTRTWPAARAGN